MKNRGPINIKYIMIFYNLMQILFNGYILSYVSFNVNKKIFNLKISPTKNKTEFFGSYGGVDCNNYQNCGKFKYFKHKMHHNSVN